MQETICVPKQEFLKMKQEIESLRNTGVYKRLLEFGQCLVNE